VSSILHSSSWFVFLILLLDLVSLSTPQLYTWLSIEVELNVTWFCIVCSTHRIFSMGHTVKRRRVRHGLSRPGPAARAAEAALQEELRASIREAARVRKARQRERDRSSEEDTIALARNPPDEGVDDSLSVREANRISLRIAQYIVEELRSCPGPSTRRIVMERVLRHNTVFPLLPEYYPRPQEAKAINAFLENFRHELQLVKVANSNELLARKSALLDAAVSLGVEGVRAFSRVLDTTTESISLALKRRVYALNPEETLPRLRISRNKREGLSEYIRSQIQAWWNGNTRVSPNKKDVVRHRVGPNIWEEPHPTHYLCETQVCYSHH
jgi:hypothetical protein